MPSLNAFTGSAVLIGKEMNSMPTLGSSMSALVTIGSISGEKPAVVSSGLPKLPYGGRVSLIVLSVAGSSSGKSRPISSARSFVSATYAPDAVRIPGP